MLVIVLVLVIVIVIGSRSSRRGAESAEAILDADERGFRGFSRQADIHRIISFSYPVVCLGTCSLVLVLGD